LVESDGDGPGAGAVGVALGVALGVVDVVVDGVFFSSLAHEAVKPTIATIAVLPAITATLRATRPDVMSKSYLSRPG
jgi:hypothetical protein